MKVVQSLGGPLIGLDRRNLGRWSGNDEKNFFRNEERFADDYDALISIKPKRIDVCKLSGDGGDCVLITMPLRTAVISNSETCICVVQVDYADEDWSFARVNGSYFAQADFSNSDDVIFTTMKCEFIFFDAAYPGSEIGDEFLSFPLSEGTYRFRSCAFQPDDRTGLLLYKIVKVTADW